MATCPGPPLARPRSARITRTAQQPSVMLRCVHSGAAASTGVKISSRRGAHLRWVAALRRRRAHMEAASLHSRREIAASYSTRSPPGTPGHGYFATWRAIPETSIVSIHGLVAASGGRFRDRERAPRTGIPRVVLEARDSHPTPFSRKREKSRLDFSLFAALTGSDSAARLVARPTADPS